MKELQKKLFNEKKNGWENLSSETKREIYNYCDSYMNFLNNGKTEREIKSEMKNKMKCRRKRGRFL